MAHLLHAADPIPRDTRRSHAPGERVGGWLRGPVWVATLSTALLCAGTAQATTKKPHAAAVSARSRACSDVTRTEVHATFGGTVGAGKGHSYAHGRTECVFSLTGKTKIALADRKPSLGAVTVERIPVSAKSAQATVTRFDALEHAKHRPAACTSAWKTGCPVTGIGQAAIFLSRAAGGGGSGLLRIVDGSVIIDIGSDVRLARSRAWAAGPQRRGYRVNQADLIALGRRIAPARGANGSTLSAASARSSAGRSDLPSARAVFESLTVPTVRLRNTVLVSWKTPRHSAVLGAPTGYACYKGPSQAGLSFADSVAAHAALSCVFARPAPGIYFFKVTVHFAHGGSGSSHLLKVTVPTIPPAISGITVTVTTSGTAGAGTYTYQLSWTAPAAPNGDPSTYYSYDVYVRTNTGSEHSQSQAAIAPLLVGATPSTTYTYTVPYEPGVLTRLFEVGAVHDGLAGPLAEAAAAS